MHISSNKLKVLSLFSGIGGLCELGIRRANLSQEMQVTQFVENDSYCQRVLMKHYHVPIHADIKTYHAGMNQFDIICGGFPCQNISSAGDRTGLVGNKSSLWWEMFRLIKEVRPTAVLIENVANLVNNGLHEITTALHSVGYDARWQVLSSASCGKPHLRRRLFIIAFTHTQSCGRAAPWDKVTQAWTDIAPQREITQGRLLREASTGVRGVANELSYWLHRSLDTNAIPYRKERLIALGNAVDPAVAAIAWQQLYRFCFEPLEK